MSEGQQAGGALGENLEPHEDEAKDWEAMEWERPWMGTFLRGLSAAPVVAAAARLARINPWTAWHWRKRDEEFAAAWDEAKNIALDMDEREVHRRGRLGYDKVIERSHIEYDSERKIVKEVTVRTTVHEFSDNMLLAHLRANRPEKWRERVDHRVGGQDGGPIQHEVVSGMPRTRDRVLELLRLARELELPDALPELPVSVNGSE